MEFSPSSNPSPQKEKSETVNTHLPEELISEILLWLPVKILCRFRCVSKSFRAIIDNPDFINKQFRTSSENMTHRKLIFEEVLTTWTRRNRVTWFYVCNMDDGLEENLIFRNERQPRKKLSVRGYCNGLFLLSDEFFKLVLWNPSIKQYRILPACHFDFRSCWMGLGYDSAGDDYKVVCIVWGNASRAWIFGLKSNLWRMIDLEFFPYAYGGHIDLYSAYFAHGNLHCYHQQKIVAIDVAKEKSFQVVQPVYPTKGCVAGMHVLDGCLCISFFSCTQLEKARLYVSKKDADDYTWHILCSVSSQLPRFLESKSLKEAKVVGYLKGGDKIMMDVGLNFVVSYDLKGDYFEKIDVAPSGCKYGKKPIMFTESLVSVGFGAISNMLYP